jgi:SRSO17 transposase
LLANINKTDNGVVLTSSLWAEEEVYYPLEAEPYIPMHRFGGGKDNPKFRTKTKACQLMKRSFVISVPFRAVVADSFYDEDQEFKHFLRDLGVGYVLSLKKSHCW